MTTDFSDFDDGNDFAPWESPADTFAETMRAQRWEAIAEAFERATPAPDLRPGDLYRIEFDGEWTKAVAADLLQGDLFIQHGDDILRRAEADGRASGEEISWEDA